MTTVLVFAVPFVVILVLAAAALRQVFGDTMRSRIITLGVLLAVLRIGSLWFLQYHAWTRTESLSYLPLALLLMPEALLASGFSLWDPAPRWRACWDSACCSLEAVFWRPWHLGDWSGGS